MADHGAGESMRIGDPYRAVSGAAPPPLLDPQSVRDLVVGVVAGNHFKHFAQMLALGRTVSAAFEEDLPFQHALGFAAWVERQESEAIECALRVVALDKTQVWGYRLLGMAHLTAGRPTEAYLALSAGVENCAPHEPLLALRVLAQNLMEGRRQVEFAVDGISYRFALSCFNGQAMEAALVHSGGSLTELDELRFLRDELGQAQVILEVGTMVGNHTVFLMKTLKPSRVLAFDANVLSIGQTQVNCLLNDGEDVDTELVLIHKAVGGEVGRINLIGTEVELTTLDAEVSDHVDFMKIDVDGMELRLLEGARQLIGRCRPRIMIEVSHGNMPDFEAFLRQIDYVVKKRFERDVDTNCFVVPAGG